MKEIFENAMADLFDVNANLLFDPRVEDMENGDAADHVLLAVASIKQAIHYLNMASRRVE